METIDVRGHWWLPGSTEKIPGTLSVEADGRAKLLLIGALRSEAASGNVTHNQNGSTTVSYDGESLERGGNYPRILGQAGNTLYTLADCLQNRRVGGLFESGDVTEDVTVQRVFRRVHFDNEDEAYEFESVTCEIDGLAEFCLLAGITRRIQAFKGDWSKPIPTISVDPPDDLDLKVAEASVKLMYQWGTRTQSFTEQTITQDCLVKVEFPTLTSVDALVDVISDLQDLITIACGRSAIVRSCVFRRSDLIEGQPNHLRPVAIDFFTEWAVGHTPVAPLRPSDVIFKLTDFGGPTILSNWLETARENRLALGRVMSTRYSSHMYTSDRVLNCAAALEGFDQQATGGSGTFVDIVKRCIALAGPEFLNLIGDSDKWATMLKDARHDVAHHRKRLGERIPTHYLLGETAYWLFIFCLFRTSSVDPAAYQAIADKSFYRHLGRHMKALM